MNAPRKRFQTDAQRAKRAAECRAWFKRNPGYKKAYRRRNPVRNLYNVTKERARGYGIPFTLTYADVEALCRPMRCAVTGHRLRWARSTKRRYNPWQPSLDQVRPRAGYTKRNSRVVSMIFNLCKNHWTDSVVAQFRGRGP